MVTMFDDDGMVERELEPQSTVDEIFSRIVEESTDRREQGTRFEHLLLWYLKHDPAWRERLEDVWLWQDAPTRDGEQDTGIDLVAKDATDGSYWAIQAKCYRKRLSDGDVSTFFMKALADERYGHYLLADTAPDMTLNLRHYLDTNDRDIVRLGLEDLKESNLDWVSYSLGSPVDARDTYDPRPHQRDAIDAVKAELLNADRCSLVMACGTGKTLTSLRLVEEMVGEGGMVLFLAPSISLVSQSMRGWINQCRERINCYVVCSRGEASNVDLGEAYGKISDIPFPATTNPETIARRFRRRGNALNVVFSTYQSIDVIHQAQELGLPMFDVAVCDEAHRTTGVIDGEGAFQQIHDPDFVHAAKRVYMTATPRIYGEGAKKKADEGAMLVASMDDQAIFGRIAYRLTFGMAVEQGLLTDYKIVVMQVSEDELGAGMQRFLRKDTEIEMEDAAKYIGCWKALFDRKRSRGIQELTETQGRHRAQVGDDDSKRVLHHAIAFASTIKASKNISKEFDTVVKTYKNHLEESDENRQLRDRSVAIEIKHVDGTMPIDERKKDLEWLGAPTADDETRILSNAKCLSEGIDVPDLDAIMYLNARKSKVDIIQSVGRVMRKAPGKEYGYIIIPVFIPRDADPDTVLSSGAYSVVWDVVRALRSHDERLDAKINAVSLGDSQALSQVIEVEVLDESKLKRRTRKHDHADSSQGGESGSNPDRIPGGGHNLGGGSDQEPSGPVAIQPEFTDLSTIEELAKNVQAQVVRKCGTKIYWGEWTDDIAHIAARRAEQIHRIVQDEPAREPFLAYVQGLRDSLNPGYSEEQAVTVLAQHEITKPIFDTLFDDRTIVDHNPIMRALERVMTALYDAGLPQSLEEDPTLRDLYASVRLSASQVMTDAAKQNLIKEIYNEFFTKVFSETADELGIVYTPVEVVDAQLHMVQRALEREFGQSLGDRGVHILDGFAGTGTYLCRLIEDDTLIADDQLEYKYEHDLHANEIVPLAATIMDINIEQSYHKRHGGDYQAFPGALLTDTFQMSESSNTMDNAVFLENTSRVEEQLRTPIRIIIGNPPYRAGDTDGAGIQNTKYKDSDQRIMETYVANSDATLNTSLYDSYIRAFRWASDRIGDSGIICFVSNGGWLTGAAGAGVRRCFAEEFNSIYVYNLRGNQRTQGEQSRKEGGKIFSSGSRATIAITMLVKNPGSTEHGAIHYRDIGDYLTREEKLEIVKDTVQQDPEWQAILPDKHGDWLDQRDDSYEQFIPLGIQDGTKKQTTGLFNIWSAGLLTSRDAWCYNFSRDVVYGNMMRLIDTYNSELARWENEGKPGDVRNFVTKDETRIKWTHEIYEDLKHEKPASFDGSHIIKASYRPFCKEFLYEDRRFNNRVYLQPSIFPLGIERNVAEESSSASPAQVNNIVISVGPRGVFISNILPDYQFNFNSRFFPIFWYEKNEINIDYRPQGQDTLAGMENQNAAAQGLLNIEDFEIEKQNCYIRHDAINDIGLEVFRAAYPHTRISKEDIFYYVYGILHSPEYRRRFSNNLAKELPRIPLAKDFKAFRDAGRELARLHLDYESVDPYIVKEIGDSTNPGPTVKMRYPKTVKDPMTGKKVKDLTVLQVAQNLTFEEIPLRAYEYMVNGKSALAWLIDRYQITTDKKSGIVNDPNTWSDDPRYIVDLVRRVITVSLRTLDIMESLPALEEMDPPENYPQEWRS